VVDDRHRIADGSAWIRRLDITMLDAMSTTVHVTPTLHRPDPAAVRRALARRSVAVLATVSSTGRPHAATVLYQLAGDELFVSTWRDSRKARNVAASGAAAVTIAVRRLPVGPPASVQFQTTADVIDVDDPEIGRLVAAGRLGRITSHGELDVPGSCFLRLPLPARAVTYALGMSLLRVLRNPLDAAGEVDLRAGDASTPHSGAAGR
jgi:hypothetical protein